MRQSVSDSVTTTVQDLYNSGLIDEMTTKNIRMLCIPEIKTYTPEAIGKIRKKLKLSQAALAHLFNVSPSTIQGWEKGYKKPSGPSVKLLSIADKKGLEGLI